MNNSIVGIVGQTGYGKTYFCNNIAKKLNRVLIIDPKCEFNNAYFAKKDIESVFSAISKNRFKVSAQLDSLLEYDLLFAALPEFYDYTIFIDEMSLFCSPYRCNEDMRQIVQIRGSKNKINVAWNTQRPANISRDISSQTHVVISFRVLESADAKYFSSKWRSGSGEEELNKLDVGDYRIVRGDNDLLQKCLDNMK